MAGPSPHQGHRKAPAHPAPGTTGVTTDAPPRTASATAALRAATFDEGTALLAVPAAELARGGPPAYPQDEATVQRHHDRRMKLLTARRGLVCALRSAVEAHHERALGALDQFKSVMAFAADTNVAGLVMGESFDTVVQSLPAPLNAIVGAVTVFASAIGQADEASERATLAVWIERHRDALTQGNEALERKIGHGGLEGLDGEFERLVADETPAGAARRRSWEEAMNEAVFVPKLSTRDLEMKLYDSWCVTTGGHFIIDMYRHDARYPGDESPGVSGLGHEALGGRQVVARNIPTPILDRLARLGADPLKALSLPHEVHHHERVAPGRDRWRHASTTLHNPLSTKHRQAWRGPERFNQP